MIDRRDFLRGLIGSGFLLTDNNLIPELFSEPKRDALFSIVVNEKYGFIDSSGKIIIQPQYNLKRHHDILKLDFYEGMGSIYIDDKWGFIDTTGEIVIKPQFKQSGKFSEGLSAVKTETDKYGYINKNGDWAIEPRFEFVDSFSGGLAYALLNNRSVFINKKGEVVINSNNIVGGPYSEGLSCVVINGKCGYMDKSGTIVIPPTYNVCNSFSEGFAGVGHNKLTDMLIDRKGNVVIKNKDFEEVYSFSEGLAAVHFINGKRGFINKDGHVTIEPKLDGFKIHHGFCGFSSGLASVSVFSKGELKDGFIDTDGNFAIKPQYFDAKSFRYGLAQIFAGSNKMGYINRSGEYVWEPTA